MRELVQLDADIALERQRVTGVTLGRWRQQCRMIDAVERLGAGASVTRVSFDVGYDDVSSFISVFKETMGTTPARYFDPLPRI